MNLTRVLREHGGIARLARKIARDPNADPQKAAEAYDTLFMLALDDAEVRKEVREKVEWRDELGTRAELAADLLLHGSSR